MFGTALIVFREALEAALVIGIALAAGAGLTRPGRWVAAGMGLGLLGAVLVALFAQSISSSLNGVGQELMDATVLLIAVAMLGWHNVWMSRHGRELAQRLKAVGGEVVSGRKPLSMLMVVVAVAVLREGSETVLFLYGLAAGGVHSVPMLIGGLLGLAGGALVGWLLYRGLLRIPLRRLFGVSAWLILLLAAGMAADAAGFLIQAGWLPPLQTSIWNTSHLLPEGSLLGEFLHVLVGYEARPAGMQLIFYGVTAVTLFLATFAARRREKRPAASRILSSETAAVGALAVTAAAGLMLAGLRPAQAAEYKIYSPYVVRGENEVEARTYYNHEGKRAVDDQQVYKFAAGRGLTSYWASELYGEFTKDGGQSLRYDSVEWENRFQLTPQGKYWADLGFLAEAEFPNAKGDPNQINFGPLIEKQVGRTVTTINLFLERQFGGGASSRTGFAYSGRVRWRGNPYLEPAVEFYGETGLDERNQIGPGIYGQVYLGGVSMLRYSVSMLFGLNPRAPQETAVGRLEYEFF